MLVPDSRRLRVPGELEPRGPVPAAPARLPGSIRRTTTIDASWPDGPGGVTLLRGRARDLRTSQAGVGEVLDAATLRLLFGADREIRRISVTPALAGIEALVGESTGPGYRRSLSAATSVTDLASPLRLLVDDVPGTALVSGYVFRHWHDDEALAGINRRPGSKVVKGICTGFQEGASSLTDQGTAVPVYLTEDVEEVDAGDDPLAWHQLPDVVGMSMRRSRRIDLRVEGERILVDAFFQDSCTVPGGGRQAVHEYTLTAEADLAGVLTELTPVPRVLPQYECPLAVLNTGRLLGVGLATLRSEVLQRLRATAGCTHLNDAIRALADVPELVDSLGVSR